MADINAQSVEDFADRIIYRYPGGRYEAALGAYATGFTTGLKTLVNTDTSRSYVVPQSAEPSKFFKVQLDVYVSLRLTEAGSIAAVMIVETGFFRMSIPSLNYDGKPMMTDFYKQSNESMISSQILRAVNIGDVLVEPRTIASNMQFTALSGIIFNQGAGTTGLIAVVQPTITRYKK